MWHLGKWVFFDPSPTKVQKLMIQTKIDAYIYSIYSTSTLYIRIYIYWYLQSSFLYIYTFHLYIHIYFHIYEYLSVFLYVVFPFLEYVNHKTIQPLRYVVPALPISRFQAWCIRSGIWPLRCPWRRPKIPRLRSRWPSTACATYLWLGCESVGERFGARRGSISLLDSGAKEP